MKEAVKSLVVVVHLDLSLISVGTIYKIKQLSCRFAYKSCIRKGVNIIVVTCLIRFSIFNKRYNLSLRKVIQASESELSSKNIKLMSHKCCKSIAQPFSHTYLSSNNNKIRNNLSLFFSAQSLFRLCLSPVIEALLNLI